MYWLINIIVLSISLFLFICGNLNIESILSINVKGFIFLFVAFTIIVHTIKASRLYLALYGSGIRGKEYVKTYCKVTPVSIILPYKIGELYRIYCYGYLLKDYLKGTVVILLDRFMDTVALVTLLLLVCLLEYSNMMKITNILLLFLIILFIIYYTFPSFYNFWKHYFLTEKATKNKLCGLKHLENLNKIYIEISNIVKGRGIILYCLSILAWGFELLNLVILNKFFLSVSVSGKISEYLTSALGITHSCELSCFAFLSITMLIILYLFMQMFNIFNKKVRQR